MKKRSRIYCVFLTFFIISVFFPHAGNSLSAERFYTVQTGTFTLSALSHAIKQFDTLSQKLNGKELDNLRISQTARFYVVRLGKFDNIGDAKKILQVIIPLVDDAYILTELNAGDIRIVKTYNNPRASDEYYTMLIGNYIEADDAYKQFDMLTKALIKNDLDNLRIVKADGHFDLKMGRFADYSAAINFLKKTGPLVPGAGVVKTLSAGEQIVRLYDGTAGEKPLELGMEQKPGPVTANETPAYNKPAGSKTGTKAEKVEDLFADISGHYYEQRYDKAAELLREGIKKWPDNADLYAWYGATLLNMKSPDKAYEIYQKAVDLSPDVPDYHAGVGYSLLNIYMDKARASIDAFNKALELDPDNIDALEGLGIVYVTIDKKNLAAEISNHLRDLDTEASKRLDVMIKRGVDWKK